MSTTEPTENIDTFPFTYLHINPIYFTDHPKLIEIMNDDNRQYLHIIAQYRDNTFLIPFRSNMTHKFGYRFMPHDPKSKKGLDFSKALIINDLPKYTLESQKNIPQYQHNKIKQHSTVILRKFHNYVDEYIKYTAKEDPNFKRRIGRMSSLQNFHNELGIKITPST